MEYYSTIKKKKIFSFPGKWVELEIILSEISSKSQISHVLNHLWNPDIKSKIMMMTIMGHEYEGGNHR
jgi:hypothetical protein